MVRGSIESIVIQGRNRRVEVSSPGPQGRGRAKSGSALEAAARRSSVGPRSSISTSAIQSVPLPPSPATMANSIEPSSEMPLPLEGPQAKSMSRLWIVSSFPARAAAQILAAHSRQTFWPVASTSLSSRLLTAPRPRSRKCHRVLFRHRCGCSARRATTKPPPPLKSKSISQCRTRPADAAWTASARRCRKRSVAIRRERRIRRD